MGRIPQLKDGKCRERLSSLGNTVRTFLLHQFKSIRFLFYCLALSSFLFGTRPCHAQSSGVAEYDVKAIFLYDFAKFVDWPSNSRAIDKSPLILCIVGADPFGGVLDNIVRGQRINEHEIAIRRTSKLEDLKTCQIAFVSRAENKYLSIILDSLRGSSTLVVGESQGFAERGGEIQLYLQDDSVHFAINIDAVQRAHLAINSSVLALAKIVHDQNSLTAN